MIGPLISPAHYEISLVLQVILHYISNISETADWIVQQFSFRYDKWRVAGSRIAAGSEMV